MIFYEFYNLKQNDKVFLRTNVRNIESGMYTVHRKEENSLEGCVIFLVGYDDQDLPCNFFHTSSKYRLSVIKHLMDING